MKKKVLVILGAVALLSVATAGIGKAYAYFTTNDQAVGVQSIALGDKTTIEEDYDSFKKTVRITNAADSAQAVYVRTKAFSGAEYPLTVKGKTSKWSSESGSGLANEWWYFSDPVEPGDKTEDLDVSIGGKALDRDSEPREFNVVIVYETTPAVQKGVSDDGNIEYEDPDWDRSVKAEGGENS